MAVETERPVTEGATPDEPVLEQLLGDDASPIEWASEQEKRLFWVFDDLHCPHPLSPMFYEVGGWWRRT